jgi:hypothetical protein
MKLAKYRTVGILCALALAGITYTSWARMSPMVVSGQSAAAGGGACSTSTDSSIVSQLDHSTGAGTACTPTDWRAAAFTLGATTTITQVDIWVEDDGTSGSLRVAIYTDSSGSPGSAVAGLSKDTAESAIGVTGALLSVVFDSPTQVSAGNYHIVMYGVGVGSSFKPHYLTVGSGGNLEYSSNSGSSWSDFTTGSYYFNVWGCQP